MRWWLDHLHAWQAHETDFMKLRQLAGITRQEVATLCAVKEATVRHWEAGSKPPPRAIVLLLHLSGGQLGVLDPAWQDWCLRAGQLWAPQLLGQGFRPEHLKVYEYALQERDALRREKAKMLTREHSAGVTTPAEPSNHPYEEARSDPGLTPRRAQNSGAQAPATRGSRSRKATGRPNLTTADPAGPAPDHSRRCAAAGFGPAEGWPAGAAGCGQPRLRAVDSSDRGEDTEQRSDTQESGIVGDRQVGPILVSQETESTQEQRPGTGKLIQGADLLRESVVLHKDDVAVQIPVILGLQRLDDARHVDRLRHIGLKALHLTVKADQLSAANIREPLHRLGHNKHSETSDRASLSDGQQSRQSGPRVRHIENSESGTESAAQSRQDAPHGPTAPATGTDTRTTTIAHTAPDGWSRPTVTQAGSGAGAPLRCAPAPTAGYSEEPNGNYPLCAIESAGPAPPPRPVRWWLDHLHAWQAHETDFMKLRQLAGITRQEVATLCAVKEATVRHWEAGSKPPPRAIVLLLHLSGGQLGVLDPAWQDWCLRAGQLWAPHLLGQGF